MILLDLAGTRPYVPFEERAKPESEQTWFIIRDLTEREMVRVMDSIGAVMGEDGEARVGGSGSRVYHTLKSGLIGIDPKHPAYLPDGGTYTPPVDEDGRVSDELLERISFAVKQELYVAIQNRLTMQEDEVEKQDAQPSAQPSDTNLSTAPEPAVE